jgi:hypothetical protein
MLSHAELLAELRDRIDTKIVTQAQIARILDVPRSRVAEIFRAAGPRKITVDEAKALVEALHIEEPRVRFAKAINLRIVGLDALRLPVTQNAPTLDIRIEQTRRIDSPDE